MTDEQEELREALKKVAVSLKEAAVPFALGGGYAAWALGGPEPEHDVDFVVAEEDASRAEHALAETGLRVEHPPEDWLFKVFDGPGSGAAMVDVLFRIAGDPVQRTLLERSVEVDVLSVRMPVLSSTDTIASKLVALSEHSCDFGKVLPSARALREQVDWAALRTTTKGNPYAEACLFLLDQLGIPAGDQP